MLGGSLLEGSRSSHIPRSEDMKASTKIGTSGSDDGQHTTDFRKMIAFIGAAYFLTMTAFIVPVACIATVVLLFPLMWLNMSLFNNLENRLCKFVNDHWVAASAYCGLNVIECGTNLADFTEKRCLFLVNHLGLLDHFVVMQGLHNKDNVPGSWMWVIYNIWKYTPLGVMWTSHGNFFVNGGASKRAALLKTFKNHLKTTFYKFDYRWIIMYPEGSRLFLIKESCIRFAEKLGLQPLKHCAHPRTGAAHAVMDVLAPSQDDVNISRCGARPPVEYIIDATLGYAKGDVPNIGSAMFGEWPHSESNRVCIHYDIIKVNPEWADEEKLKNFLYNRYEIKDKLLDAFYRTGSFPGEARPVVVPQSTMLISQLFWMSLYYIHYTIWIRPLCALLLKTFLGFFN